MRFVGSLDAGAAPDFAPPPWWSDVTAGTRPVVHVTQGTVANSDLDALVKRTIRVLSGDDVLVVATTARAELLRLIEATADPASAAHVPGN